MLKSSVVHLDTRNVLIFKNLYIIHDNFEKKTYWQNVLNFTTRERVIGWLFLYN